MSGSCNHGVEKCNSISKRPIATTNDEINIYLIKSDEYKKEAVSKGQSLLFLEIYL